MLEIAPLLWKRQWSPTIPRTSIILHQINNFPISPGNPPVHAPGFPRLQCSPSRCPPAQQSSPRGQGWFMEGQRWQPEHTQPLAPLSRHPKLQLPPASWIFSCKKKDFSQCLLKVSTEWSISPKWCSMNVNKGPAIASGRLCIRDPSEGKIRHLVDDQFDFIRADDHRVCLLVCLFLFICFYLRLGLFISFVCLFVSSFTYEMFLWISVAWNESWHSATSWKQITKEVGGWMVSMGLNVNIHLMPCSKIGQFLCSAYLTLFDEISQTGEPYLYLIHVPMGSDHWCMKLCKTPCWRLCWDI